MAAPVPRLPLLQPRAQSWLCSEADLRSCRDWRRHPIHVEEELDDESTYVASTSHGTWLPADSKSYELGRGTGQPTICLPRSHRLPPRAVAPPPPLRSPASPALRADGRPPHHGRALPASILRELRRTTRQKGSKERDEEAFSGGGGTCSHGDVR
uniref:Uncharacterized protein n=1 Tax=Leersia perrieri TaxID=77586 RepID=A0A0D9W3E4_9ORYZ